MRRAMIAHLLLALGVLSALFAALAVFDQAWEQVYAWLGISVLADVTRQYGFHENDSDYDDGVDASHLKSELNGLGAFCGGVFVPVIAMLHAGFLDGYLGIAIGALVILTAIYRLTYATPTRGTHQMGVPDVHPSTYQGLPAIWSLIGFYLHAFDATPMVGVLALGVAIILSLLSRNVPSVFYSEIWRNLTRLIALVWFVTAAVTLIQGFPATPTTKAILLAIAVYGVLLAAITPQPASPPFPIVDGK